MEDEGTDIASVTGRIAKALILLLVGIFGAFLSWENSALLYYSSREHASAPLLVRDHPLVSLKAMEEQWDVNEGFKGDPTKAQLIARGALAARPIHPAAMRFASALPYSKGDVQTRMELLRASEALSRRDLRTQTALLQVEANLGNVEEVLRSLDRALLVRPQAGTEIFPLLLPALGDARARAELIPYVERDWLAEFLNLAVASSPSPSDVLSFVDEAQVPLDQFDRDMLLMLVRRLAGLGEGRAALELAQRLGFQQSALEEFKFTEVTTDELLAPLAWRLASEAAGRASLAGEGQLDVTVFSGRRVMAAERITTLSPGDYTLAVPTDLRQGANPILEWTVQCRRNSAWRSVAQEIVQPETASETLRLPLTFPSGCSNQKWQLFAQSGDSSVETSILISPTLTRR